MRLPEWYALLLHHAAGPLPWAAAAAYAVPAHFPTHSTAAHAPLLPPMQAALDMLGGRMTAVSLNGFVFFGSANSIGVRLQQVRKISNKWRCWVGPASLASAASCQDHCRPNQLPPPLPASMS